MIKRDQMNQFNDNNIRIDKSGRLDPSQFSEFDLRSMYSRLCSDNAVMREVEAAHNARGIFHIKGKDGTYHVVRRKPR